MRVEIGTALAATQRKTGQAVLQDHLKPQELKDRQIDGLVETGAAFVAPDCTVELNSPCAVHMDLMCIVLPGYREGVNAFRLDETLKDRILPVDLFIGVNDRTNGFKSLLHRLQEFRLIRIPLGSHLQHFIHIRHVFVLLIDHQYVRTRYSLLPRIYLLQSIYLLPRIFIIGSKRNAAARRLTS